jgi:poly-gamma-glutamate system protein
VKKLYWRPQNVSRTALVLVSVLALAVMSAVELLPVQRKQEKYGEKMAAARLALECMKAIKADKIRLGHAPDPEIDPAETGMIGESVTAVTSNTGFLASKRTSTNPNWAAVIVDLLNKAGVQEGDVVAVGLSGSFPALNVATYAAIMTLELEPIVIVSASSSEWGANHVDYLWLDMERRLREARLIGFGAAAASPGGIDDLGIGITEEGRGLIEAAIERNGVRALEMTSLADAIDKRLAVYDELADDAPIKAYINVGGGSASVGTHLGKKQFKAGLNSEPPLGAPDSVMMRFSRRGVPVIHIARIKLLAESYGLPYAPTTPLPVGHGAVFVDSEYSRGLALGGLLAIVAAMVAFLRWDVGMRMLRGLRPRERRSAPEQML